ncbi:MAG TPA: acyl-CoA thioesterase II [Rhodothermales bacterium]|nr:acyl-CoA thioesterase II [Rhodothermales bacterium]
MPDAPAPDALATFLALLDLEPLEVNLFRGQSRSPGWGRVYGGQVLAQALVAAGRTVETREGEGTRPAHSLHAYFLLPGDVDAPIVYQVDRARDGGSFTTRRVVAVQHGRPIFVSTVSFHRVETGLEHAAPPPQVAGPEGLMSEREMALAAAPLLPARLRDVVTAEQPIEYRPVDYANPLAPTVKEPTAHLWLRATGALPDDVLVHQAVLAYASDHDLLGVAIRPHGRSFLDRTLQAASLDHAIWFHRPFRADGWLLYAMDSPTAAGGRGFARGTVYDADGRLVASTAQEGLLRPVDPSAGGRPDKSGPPDAPAPSETGDPTTGR